MFLDLLDVLRAPGNVTQKPIDIAPRTVDDLDFVEPIRGEVKAVNARRNIVVSGHAATAVRQQCARCLQEFEQPLELELEAVIPVSFMAGLLSQASDEPDAQEGENELSDEELAALFDGHSLDVLELIRQATVLQLPRKPLCAEDCPGIPEADNYRASDGDSRWSALEDWKDNHGSA